MRDTEVAKHTVLFHLMTKAHGGHWKDPFEIKVRLASPNIDPPLPREVVRGIANDLVRAIQWFHGAAFALELDPLEVKPYVGEPAAYWIFDGYTLTVGSVGYQG